MLKGAYKRMIVPPPPGGGKAASAEGPGTWYFDGPAVASRQGWKLYISATLLNFLDVLAAAGPVLRAHRIPFKYVATDKVLRKQNAGLYGYSQIGKLIVCYLDERAPLGDLMHDLAAALDPFRDTAPAVPFAQPIGGGLPLYYRYGAFVGDSIRVGGQDTPDDRARPASDLFEHLANPFEAFHEARDINSDFNAFLRRFPVYETISQGGKGGLFAAFDTQAETFTDVILKVGYRNGQVLPDGRDGMDLIRREYRFFELLERHGLSNIAPRLISHGQFAHRSVLAMSRIDGKNLASVRESGELGVSDLETCLAMIGAVHDAGLYLGDAKLANFLRDAGGRIWAVDFECAGEHRSAEFDLLRTFHFTDVPNDQTRLLDRVHFLFSAIYREEKSSFSETDRVIELRTFLGTVKAKTQTEAWVLRKLKQELPV